MNGALRLRLSNIFISIFFKGHDRAIVRQTPVDEDHEEPGGTVVVPDIEDEIQDYQDCRYVGSQEAAWRIFCFNLHGRKPSVMSLAVHLDGNQMVYFHEGQEVNTLAQGPPRTMLTAFFEYNRLNPDTGDLLYVDFPEHFVWNK